MGYLQKEMERYGMEDDLITTRLGGAGDNFYTLNVPGTLAAPYSNEIPGLIERYKASENVARGSGQSSRQSMGHLCQRGRQLGPYGLSITARSF
jgi:hypothetical protein